MPANPFLLRPIDPEPEEMTENPFKLDASVIPIDPITDPLRNPHRSEEMTGNPTSLVRIQVLVEYSKAPFYVDVCPDEPVSSFKSMLEEKSGLPADKQKLIYKGRYLMDNETLRDHDLVGDNFLPVHLLEVWDMPEEEKRLVEEKKLEKKALDEWKPYVEGQPLTDKQKSLIEKYPSWACDITGKPYHLSDFLFAMLETMRRIDEKEEMKDSIEVDKETMFKSLREKKAKEQAEADEKVKMAEA